MNDVPRVLELNLVSPPAIGAWKRRALVIGVLGAIAMAVGWAINPPIFYRGYLIAYMLCIGLTLGSMAWIMVYHLTGGHWGTVTRRIFEAAMRTMPMMIVLFAPILIGIHSLYPWSRPEVLATNEHLARLAKQYLSLRFFIFRAVIYFVGWAFLAWKLDKISRRQDQPPEVSFDVLLRKISGPGLVFYALTISFAAVDWVMSLDPYWSSTIYGLLFLVGEAIISLSLAIMVLNALVKISPMGQVARPSEFLDLGKLMLACVMLWGWFALSQWLIIWAGNLPDEITWYFNRTRGGWNLWGFALILTQFCIPFVLLLSRSLKATASSIAFVALWLFLVRWVDMVWFVVPNFPDTVQHFRFSWQYVAAPIGMMGLWLAYFFRNLSSRPLLAAYDAHVTRLLEEGHKHGH
jgi:hypothetical protein